MSDERLTPEALKQWLDRKPPPKKERERGEGKPCDLCGGSELVVVAAGSGWKMGPCPACTKATRAELPSRTDGWLS